MVWNLKQLWLSGLLAALMIPAFAPATAQSPEPPHPPGPPMQQAFHMHFGRWWDNPQMAHQLGLTAEQQKKMDAIFAHYRPSLEHLHANLHRQEKILGPLIGADNPNEDSILAQIDVVAQARANLEKEFARMLLGIRRQLTPEQWQKLKVMHAKHMEQMKHHEWHHHGPDGPMPPPAPPR
ncbi:MAG: Spy/CpxP family protein refolding chaperone [Acidobacteriaceae bacterium]